MGVTWIPNLPDDLVEICRGCGDGVAVGRIETTPDVDDIEPRDLPLCSPCWSGFRGSFGVGSVNPAQIGGGKVGRRHPVQSRQAAATVQTGTQQAHLLLLVTQSSDGITCAVAANPLSHFVGHTISRNQTATRMGELAAKGLVEKRREDGVDVKRPTEGDNEGQVWIVTDAGRAEADRLERVTA